MDAAEKKSGLVSRILAKTRDIGVPEGIRPEEVKYIRLGNLMGLLVFLITLIFGLRSLLNQQYYVTILSAATFLLMFPVYLFQRRGYHIAAKMYGLVLFNLYIVLSATFMSGVMRGETNFIVAGVAILMFPKKETKWMIAMVAFSVACYYAKQILQIHVERLYIPTRSLDTLFTIVFSLAFILIAVIGRYSTIHTEELLKEREDELSVSNRELKELDELKDNLLSMVSHDLRTPMTSIKGYTSILMDKMGKLSEDRQTKYLGTIGKEADRLTRMIDDLLDLQRFEEGRMTFELADINLMKLLGESMNAFQGAAFSKNITIESELPDSAIMVNADRDRLSQIVANYLSNAIKFTSDGGKVKIKAETISENGKKQVKVSVSDTGPGISVEGQAKLFSKFQQLETRKASKQKGSGLGLALVKEIVEHHGGKVGVESEPGSGSVFYFTITQLG